MLTNLTYRQKLKLAVEDVDFGMSIKFAAEKWRVSEESIEGRISFNQTAEALEQQQAQYEGQS